MSPRGLLGASIICGEAVLRFRDERAAPTEGPDPEYGWPSATTGRVNQYCSCVFPEEGALAEPLEAFSEKYIVPTIRKLARDVPPGRHEYIALEIPSGIAPAMRKLARDVPLGRREYIALENPSGMDHAAAEQINLIGGSAVTMRTTMSDVRVDGPAGPGSVPPGADHLDEHYYEIDEDRFISCRVALLVRFDVRIVNG